MVKGFDGIAGHLTDIKDMVIDQNEWYEEMFYDGGSCSNPSDVFDINDEMPTVSDDSNPRKGCLSGAGVRKRRAEQKK